ncbi:hypothetical protein B0H34DRAFT_709362 [Crassisporium funariophilum]|nr:hypothetical protein B0H34DRAFT_709362 [Crassisporium funariophilum]
MPRRRCFNCGTIDTSTWRRSKRNPGKVVWYLVSHTFHALSDRIHVARASCATSVVFMKQPIHIITP